MDFPQYRKLSNNKAYYKILDDRNFIEIQIVGSSKFSYSFNATKYPEILKIKEMLSLELPEIEKIEAAEFNHLSDAST